jgi:hypothetical protein
VTVIVACPEAGRVSSATAGRKRFVAALGRPAQELMQGPEEKPKLRVSIGAPVVVRFGGSHRAPSGHARDEQRPGLIPVIAGHHIPPVSHAGRAFLQLRPVDRPPGRVTAGSGPGYRRTP